MIFDFLFKEKYVHVSIIKWLYIALQFKILPILSGARRWTSVILAGKLVGRRHSTTFFSEKVVVTRIEVAFLLIKSD